VLRCFRALDCERDGPRLLSIINAQLAVPQVVLQDATRRYRQWLIKNGIRASLLRSIVELLKDDLQPLC